MLKNGSAPVAQNRSPIFVPSARKNSDERYRVMIALPWTDDRVELLKRLWGAGLSANQCAAEIGGVTRNAVIGKVHRLGIGHRPQDVKRTSSRVPPAPKRSGRFNPGEKRVRIVRHAVTEGAPALAPVVPDVPPATSSCQLLDLNDSRCHWPIGDPRDPKFHFCGGPALRNRPYCAGHTQASLQPAGADRVSAATRRDQIRIAALNRLLTKSRGQRYD